MQENQDAPEVLETPVEPVEEPKVETTEEQPEAPVIDEEKEELKRKVEELDKKNKQLFERAKKQSPAKEDGLSNKDVLFLAKADVHEEDMDDLLDWAKFKKVPVSEAYKQMKQTFDLRNEERKTAAATQVKGSPRGTTKVSGEDLAARASRGEEINLTEETAAAIINARLQRKLGKRK